METLNTYIAKQLLNGSRRKFSRLMADNLLETSNMATNSPSTVTTSMNVADSPASRTGIGREIPNSPASLAAEAPARLSSEATSDSINSGFNVTSQVPAPAAKCVGANHLEGSNQGDHRAPANTADLTAFAKNAPGPRDAARQFQNSRNDTAVPFQSTVECEVGG